MAKYRVIKAKDSDDDIRFYVQKQNWFTGKWYSVDDWSSERSALLHYSRLTGGDLPDQKVIVESK